jgi:hypothetical protein
MTIAAVANTIRSRFSTLVEDTQSIPVQYDNAPDVIPGDALWARCSIVQGDSFRVSIGTVTADRYRSVGVMVASIFSPMDQGDSASLGLAQVVRDAFISVTDGGVTFKTPSIASIGKSGTKWWQVNVTCPFYFDDLE